MESSKSVGGGGKDGSGKDGTCWRKKENWQVEGQSGGERSMKGESRGLG
jgi:hypothetical protein